MEGLAVFEKAWYTFTVGALFAPQPAYGQRIAAQAAIGRRQTSCCSASMTDVDDYITSKVDSYSHTLVHG